MTAERILMGGAPEGFDARILVRELSRGQPVVHVARDDKRAEAMRAAETARQNLSNAIETVQEGFALFDREERMSVLKNDLPAVEAFVRASRSNGVPAATGEAA